MIVAVFVRVFSHLRYIFGAVGVAFTVVIAALLLPNFKAIQQVMFSGSVEVSTKFYFLVSLLGSLSTNFTILSAIYLISMALLFGINIALLTFYIRRRQEVAHSKRVHISSIGGLISAVLGIGCAACGSVVLTAVFGLLGVGSVITFLPFHGLEFGLVGICLLSLSVYYLIKRIDDPLVCPVV